MELETMISHYCEGTHTDGAVVPPLFQNSLFVYDSWEEIDEAFDDRVNSNIYSRGNNPTVRIVENKLAKLAGAEKGKLFSSGMAAISSAILHCVKAGDHVITLNNIYGPANNFLSKYLKQKLNLAVSFVSGETLEDFEDAIQENTTLIYLESPTSVVFSLQDIENVAKLAKVNGIKTIVDNTWCTPLFQKPLSVGIDLEVHSCSKYIGGHSDVVSGLIVGSAKELDSIFVNEYELLGGKMAPFEAWLLLRSLRTLPMRMARHQNSAFKVAAFLENHPSVEKVNYPGLKTFAQHELAQRQMTGFSGLLSFQLSTGNLIEIKAFFNSLRYFKIGVSWGGHESLVYAPAISYLKELTSEQFSRLGVHLGDIRISVGLEDPQDLIDDLAKSLENVKPTNT